MTRISDRLLIQPVDHHIVLVDEHTGAEITVPLDQMPMVLRTLWVLYLHATAPQDWQP